MLKLLKLTQDQRHHIYYLGVLDQPANFETPFKGRPYSCLLWATRSIDANQRAQLADALVASECRLACCGGIDAASWEQAIDLASIAYQDAGYSERFVPTTTHASEDDATFYFVWCSDSDDDQFTKHLILIIGQEDATITRLFERVKKQVLAREGGEEHNTNVS